MNVQDFISHNSSYHHYPMVTTVVQANSRLISHKERHILLCIFFQSLFVQINTNSRFI